MEEERTDLLTQVAIWYYEEGLNQADIADRIGKSRSMVSRLLDQARCFGRQRWPALWKADARMSRTACSGSAVESTIIALSPVSYTHLTLPTNREV